VYEAELAFANELADEAGEIGMRYFRGSFEIRTKADMTPVTQADLEIEEVLRRRIAERYPDDAVLGEEGGLRGEADRVWVVDPIDGTRNFAAGIQIWGTLISLVDRGRPVVGVAGAPALGERYAAERDAGATLNGALIHVSHVHDVTDAFVLFGTIAWKDPRHRDRFTTLAARVARTRAFGDFWGHMLVARGAAEVMIEEELRTWDTAAVQCIVEEAGGRMTSFRGGEIADHGSVLTSNGRLHDDLVRLLR